ncbi:MAG: AAA family ATPase [Chloroflexota bacterium]|nr:AAA family ATPase [Chloroflexota bacterium]
MKRRLWRVHIKNYKSLATVVVDLSPFTVLVGRNGSGKSNFVDALRFVAECLQTSVTLALQNRGGINAVRRHSTGHPTHFGFRLFVDLGDGASADYSFEIAARQQGRFEVKRERCIVQAGLLGPEHRYQVVNGQFTREAPGIRPRIEPDRLALSVVSAVEEFRPVYDFLTSMRFYTLAPDQIRELQVPDAGEILKRDGSNAAAVLREVQRRKSESYMRLCRLLSKVVPGTSNAEYLSLGQKETLRFKQDVGDKAPWNFNALSMSDGTLRALGILLAVYQVSTPTLIVIEEPEATIHPAALDVIIDILKEGASYSQTLITTHSPDVLDNRKIRDDEIRIVELQKGRTIVAPASSLSRQVIRDRLYTPGELLRMEQLQPDMEAVELQTKQLHLFGSPEKVVAR